MKPKSLSRVTVICGACILLLTGLGASAQMRTVTERFPVYYPKYGNISDYSANTSMFVVVYGRPDVANPALMVGFRRVGWGSEWDLYKTSKGTVREDIFPVDALTTDPRLTHSWFMALNKPYNPALIHELTVEHFLRDALKLAVFDDDFELSYLKQEIGKRAGSNAMEKIRRYTEELVPVTEWAKATSILSDYRQRGEIVHDKSRVTAHYLNLPVRRVQSSSPVQTTPPRQTSPTPRTPTLEERVRVVEREVDSLKLKGGGK